MFAFWQNPVSGATKGSACTATPLISHQNDSRRGSISQNTLDAHIGCSYFKKTFFYSSSIRGRDTPARELGHGEARLMRSDESPQPFLSRGSSANHRSGGRDVRKSAELGRVIRKARIKEDGGQRYLAGSQNTDSPPSSQRHISVLVVSLHGGQQS